ncbi:MAG: hypothetical protein OXC11_16210 [Rhodospirillales bacterium]|nr:hypothetical protein [Rhodospirillales bacterium]
MIRPWHFYGRTQESQDLACHPEILPDLRGRRGIGTYTIRGRRGVGKTRLLHEVRAARDPAIPFLHAELSAGDASACLEMLRDTVTEAGLSSLLADMPVCPALYSDRSCFKDIVRALLLKGVIVALDEFHHATAAGLALSIKKMIDDLARTSDSIPPGKLVLMGSHEQQMQRMFRADHRFTGEATPTLR